jgi:pyruvate/2-oxoglutarate dehydrogenase complex dihydrolipoamide acyltransferase (E2) component
MLKTLEVPPLGEQKQTETLLNFWYVEAGQPFEAGDDIAELVTDKAAFNLPAPEDGTLVRILVKEGEKVTPGQKLAEFESLIAERSI